MQIKPIEVFCEDSNYGIVRMPGRQFPGCVIQGDSLSILLSDAKELFERVKNSSDVELVECAEDLVNSIDIRLKHYEQVMAAHNVPLPYSKRA